MGSRTLCRALYVDNDNLPSDVRVGDEVTMWQIPAGNPAAQSTIHKYEAELPPHTSALLILTNTTFTTFSWIR